MRAAVLVAILATGLTSTTQPAAAVGETLVISLSQLDGTGPFDATDDPGNDSSDTNGIVRTNDNVAYAVEISVNNAAADNVTFTLALPQGMELDAVPPFCGAGSAITPATLPPPPIPVVVSSWTTLPTQTLVCNAGARTAFSTFTYPVVATVRPEVPNGTTLDPVTAEVVSDDVTTPELSNEVDVTVSARAQFDISKNSSTETENRGYFSTSGLRPCSDGSGRSCYQYNYPVLIAAPSGGKGTSPLQMPVTFTDDLSIASMYGPAVLTDPDYIAAGAGADAKYGPILVSCRSWNWASPNTYAGDLTNSVRDSGTTTCTQSGGAGTPVLLSVDNMDSSAYTTPTEAGRPAGRVLPLNRGYVYSYAVTVQIPMEAVRELGVESAAGGTWTLNWRNEFKDFAPLGFDGVVNDPAAQDAFNDYRASSVVATTRGSFNKYFVGVGDQPGNIAPSDFNPGFAVYEGPIGSTGLQTGEGQVFPGEQVLSMLNFDARNGTTGLDVSYIGCDGWDPTLLQLNADNYPASSVANAQRLPSNGAAVWVHGANRDGYALPGGAVTPPNLTVEYGNGVVGAGLTCDDADSPGGWHSDPADVPGNNPVEAANGVYTGVSMVRVHVINEPHTRGNGTWSWVAIGLRATPGLPTNTLLPNFATVKMQFGTHTMAELLASSDSSWRVNDYVPATNVGGLGDRLWTGGAIARLVKEVKNPSTGNWVTTTPAVTGGQTVEYRIRPSLTASVSFPLDLPVRVEDCLPIGQSYVASTLSPSIVQSGASADAELACPAGRVYIRWDIAAATINAAITPIEYTTVISPVATSGVKVNEALVSTPSDPSAVAERSTQAAVQVTQPAGIELDKVALTPIVEVNRAGETNEDPLRWRIDMANLDTVPGPTDPDVIDVLPANGLGTTNFNGTLAFDSAQVVAGGPTTDILYTAAPPASIDVDAFDPSNDAATGTTVWCDQSSGGVAVMGSGIASDCPAATSDVTGLRIVRPGAFGPGAFISVEVQMTPSANAADDIYDNVTAARGIGLILPVGPVQASEVVVDSSISNLVWEDTNGNGLQELGEPPIDGIVVNLTGSDSDGNSVTRSTVTSGGGIYRFDGLASGDYEVTFSLPPAGPVDTPVFTFQRVGSVGALDSDGDPVTGIAVVSLNANADLTTVDQGILYPDPAVTIVKALNGDDANLTPGLEVPLGSTINVTFDVANTGNIVLSPVVVSDDTIAASDISCPTTVLAPDDTMQCTATMPAPALDTVHTNTATVTATPLPLPDGTLLDNEVDTDVAYALSTWAELSGHVYSDTSNDGVFDSGLGEVALGGVTITLYDQAGLEVADTTTNAMGEWEFRGLGPGTYYVVETQPFTHLDGIDTVGSLGGDDSVNDELSAIVLANGDRASDYDFGELLPASVSGLVVDNFGDPIESVTITLTGLDDLGNSVSLATVTDPDGSWSFDGLRPGTYTIVESQPIGFADGDETPGGPLVTSTTNDQFVATLDAGADAADNVFIEKYGSISGTVFHDHNNDGVQDPDDSGIPGVALALRNPAGNVLAMVTTLTDGSYLFDHLLAGEYHVAESTPITFDDGIDTLGDLGGDDSVNDLFVLTLPAGHDAIDYNFAEIGTSITGAVWIDDNTDGVLDASEPDRAFGVTVTLVAADGSELATTTTNAAGFYVFDDLFPGDYTVVMTQPSSHGLTTTTELDVVLPAGGLSEIDFGLNLGSISGTIWSDTFGNGLAETGEPPIAAVELILLDDLGTEITRTTTDSSGNYQFTGLPVGAYSVEVVPPTATTITLPNQGPDETIDSDVDWNTNRIDGIVVACPATGCDQPLGDTPDNDGGLTINTVDLAVEKTLVTTGEVEVGDLVEWAIVVTNNGTTASAATMVEDRLPGELAYVSASGPSWVCSETLPTASSTTSLRCLRSIPLLAGATAATLLVVTEVVAAGASDSILNEASVSNPIDGIDDSSTVDNISESILIVTTTPPPTVPAGSSTTTTPPQTSTTTSTPGATTTTTQPVQRQPGRSDPIAFTGASSLQLALVAVGLVLFGGVLLGGARRRRRS